MVMGTFHDDSDSYLIYHREREEVQVSPRISPGQKKSRLLNRIGAFRFPSIFFSTWGLDSSSTKIWEVQKKIGDVEKKTKAGSIE